MTSDASVAIAQPVPAPLRTPARLPEDARTGLAFHRLVFARQRRAWWTPLLTGVLGAAFYAVMMVVLLVPLVVIALFTPGFADEMIAMGSTVRFDLADPIMLTILLGSIALMLPAYLAASRIVNGRRVGHISSAAGRLRWRWMLLCTAIAVVVYAIVQGLSLLLPPAWSGGSGGGEVLSPSDNPALLWSLLAIVLVIPVQAAAEEYVFRGYLMQAIGRWLRHPLWAMLLPVPLFVLGHLYDVAGQISVGVFAVAAGWLTWRTGGLEAAIAVHVVNNLTVALLGLAGLVDVNDSGSSIVGLVVSTVMIVGYVAAIEWVFPKRNLPRTLVLTPPVADASIQARAHGAFQHGPDLGVRVDGQAVQDQPVGGGHEGARGL